ncbi:MAG: phosphoribosylformylglycinamidine synthase subunit PurL [bacterium]|nr:phosphoribosylformylglycinamidine synthase subunit PurL [bacterium]MDD5353762.1 phosphoribosylformylglycinamidine synthase subunit PurL [bacterium]MDD5756775.1 phosphoribosylformylglycinamidine synthase subunit PurL [bacterium]
MPNEVKIIGILNKTDGELLTISSVNLLALNIQEMKTIQEYFRKLRRDPTDVELETLAQTWSEHCKHKTLRGVIEYRRQTVDGRWQTETIDNLLKQTVIRSTKELNLPWCLSVFKDNAGVIDFDQDNALAFKVETHNHPSALEPYGGAGTGIGGVIRDILGVGLGAKPVINTDVFCFGPPETPFSSISEHILHPKRIAKGVVSGVRDYGNRMGIPTANGAVIFEESFIYNPLVFCGTVGIMPKKYIDKKVSAGDLVLAVGGRTGRDGIHGATFSSIELDKDTEISAVQIGNPIIEKKVTDALLQARDAGLYNAITDCGAGGFSSAVGELGEECGAKVYLDKAPLKYQGLLPWEIWISESQERMVLAVPPGNLTAILKIFNDENVEATVIGEFTATHNLELYYGPDKVADLDMDFLHNGVPKYTRKAVWKEVKHKEPDGRRQVADGGKNKLGITLKKILALPTVASKEWIIRQYDHEVQGGSIIKPLTGADNDGPSDAAVNRPDLNSWKGFAIANGINPRLGLIDPYWMTASVIDEALRNITCVGGDLQKTALLDNFCWGNPNKEEQLGGIVRAAKACYDAAMAYGTPFISGKDSLNNEYSLKGKSISIAPTMLISAISVVDDVRNSLTMDAKQNNNLVYLLGDTYNELGGSQYFALSGHLGNNVPKVDFLKARALMISLGNAISQKLVCSCHDLSEGGLAVAAAEMAFAGGLGMEIKLADGRWQMADKDKNDTTILFSESNSRFIVEVEPKKAKAFEKAMIGTSFCCIGKIKSEKNFIVKGLKDKNIIKETITALKEAWRGTLKW